MTPKAPYRDLTPRRPLTALAMILVAALAISGLASCGPDREVSYIEPIPSSREVNNPELGPAAVDPLSFGPGEKDSPSWSPSGERIAFIVDGYVSDKALAYESSTRRTTRDLGAERVAWPASGEELAILGEGTASRLPDEDRDTHPLYVTRSGEGQLKIERLSERALTINDPSGEVPMIAALEAGPYESRISVINPESGELETYERPVQGRITELSVSPDGDRALATAIAPNGDGSERYELHSFELDDGDSERITRLPAGMEVFGPPQQTTSGIYFVAGERSSGAQSENGDIQYSLYQLPEGSTKPAPASGVGLDFVTSSIKASPDGDRLALLGRRDSGSSTNLYVLDLSDGSLYAATSNENMEIRTGASSLDWRPDGESVAIVARSDITGPRVYSGSASSLLANFYNLYEIPVDDLQDSG